MDRVDMGANVGKDAVLCSVSTQAVKAVAKVPVWVKLTPATADIVEEARATFLGGADAIVSSNTWPSVPPVDPLTGEFEVNVDGYVSSGGLGGPAILPLSLAKMASMAQAFPDGAFSGIGGISTFADALNYFMLGCGTVQVATAAMLDHAVGPNVIRNLTEGLTAFLDHNADRGWTRLEDFRGRNRGKVVAQGEIRRPDGSGYAGGYEEDAGEGYARASGEA
jgi:dihydropyrimidine dehydrogenase (NAD+) subunit PreA